MTAGPDQPASGRGPAFLLLCAGLAGALALAAAAAVGHGVPATPEAAEARRLVETASRFLLLHAAALVGLAAAAAALPGRWWWATGFLWIAGLVGFCGGLGLRGATGIGLGPVVPAGGAALIAGWIALALAAALRLRRR